MIDPVTRDQLDTVRRSARTLGTDLAGDLDAAMLLRTPERTREDYLRILRNIAVIVDESPVAFFLAKVAVDPADAPVDAMRRGVVAWLRELIREGEDAVL